MLGRTGAGGSGRSGRSSRRDAIAGVLVGAVVGAVAALAWPERRAAAEQPIAFDHRLHVRELEIDCALCHAFEEPAPYSGLPGLDACATCHAQPLGKRAEEAKVVRAVQAGAALPWAPLYREPSHVFFSHRLHATVAAIACARCHPSIADARAPPARVRPIRMGDCLECHAGAGAPARCTACHR
jgi:hypothetical protein